MDDHDSIYECQVCTYFEYMHGAKIKDEDRPKYKKCARCQRPFRIGQTVKGTK